MGELHILKKAPYASFSFFHQLTVIIFNSIKHYQYFFKLLFQKWVEHESSMIPNKKDEFFIISISSQTMI